MAAGELTPIGNLNIGGAFRFMHDPDAEVWFVANNVATTDPGSNYFAFINTKGEIKAFWNHVDIATDYCVIDLGFNCKTYFGT